MALQLYDVPVGGYFVFASGRDSTAYQKVRQHGSCMVYTSEGGEEKTVWGWEWVLQVSRPVKPKRK